MRGLIRRLNWIFIRVGERAFRADRNFQSAETEFIMIGQIVVLLRRTAGGCGTHANLPRTVYRTYTMLNVGIRIPLRRARHRGTEMVNASATEWRALELRRTSVSSGSRKWNRDH